MYLVTQVMIVIMKNADSIYNVVFSLALTTRTLSIMLNSNLTTDLPFFASF